MWPVAGAQIILRRPSGDQLAVEPPTSGQLKIRPSFSARQIILHQTGVQLTIRLLLDYSIDYPTSHWLAASKDRLILFCYWLLLPQVLLLYAWCSTDPMQCWPTAVQFVRVFCWGWPDPSGSQVQVSLHPLGLANSTIVRWETFFKPILADLSNSL